MDATAINEPGAGRSAASITLENVGKTYPDGTVAVAACGEMLAMDED